MIAAGAEFADGADRNGLAGVGVDDLVFHIGQRQADRVGLVLDAVGGAGLRRDRGAFGLAENNREWRAELFFQ